MSDPFAGLPKGHFGAILADPTRALDLGKAAEHIDQNRKPKKRERARGSMTVKILKGNCRDVLRSLDAESVQTCITSPPYWGLRDYGIPPSIWGGDPECEHDWNEETWYTKQSAGKSGAEAFSEAGPDNAARLKSARWRTAATCQHCQAWRGSFGLEPSPDLYVAHAVLIFREVARVLRPDGTLWLNLGDSYSGSWGNYGGQNRGKEGGQRAIVNGSAAPNPAYDGLEKWRPPNSNKIDGIKPKDLIGIPWAVAFALRADGWYLRCDIIWSKPNPMPESVTDRPTKAHEYLFLFAKSDRYYYDHAAIAEDSIMRPQNRLTPREANPDAKVHGYAAHRRPPGGTNKPDNRKPFAPGQVDARGNGHDRAGGTERTNGVRSPELRNKRSVWEIPTAPFPEAHFATFPPALIKPCILAGCPEGGTVIDPFGGAGTTGLVADRLGRDAILIELNPEYAAMAERRIKNDAPLFADVGLQAAE